MICFASWVRRPRHLYTVALCLLLHTACASQMDRAMVAADLAAARGQPEREEALLKTVEMRFARARARGQATPEAMAEERTLLTRLGHLYAGPLMQLSAAVQTWQQVLDLTPPAEEAGALLMTMADVAGHRQGDKALAAQQFERAASLLGARPAAASALLAAAEAYLTMGNIQRSVQLCAQVQQSWQGSTDAARAQLVIGEARRQSGDVAGAIEAYMTLLEQRPAGALASVTKAKLAQAHQARGESAQALDYYHAALPQHPNAPMIQDAIARVREQMVQIAPNKSILRGVGAAAQVARR